MQAGDLVLTRLDDGRTAARRISRTAVHPDLEVLYVGYRVQGGAGASESLTVGFHHPFRVEPDGWTAAVRLQPQSGPTGHLSLADGSDESLPLAFALYLHAARQDHSEAQVEVASRYLRGTGVGEDSAEAARWYQRAAEQGSGDAQAALAPLSETGNGVEADPGQARLLYERAAQQGYRDAQFKLGLRASRKPTLAELGIEPAPQVKRPWWKLH